MTSKNILKRAGRIVVYILLFVLVLLATAFIFINTSYGKKIVKNQVQSFLVKKLKTPVRIGSVDYSLPKWLELSNVYIEDQHKDTLLYGGTLAVDMKMLKLISGEVDINKIELKNINVHINRISGDTVFNYQFIVDAFAGTPKDTTKVDTSAGTKINIDKIFLDNIIASFKDDVTGIDFLVRLGKFQTGFKQFDIDKMAFSIPDIVMENVSGHMYQNKPLLQVQPTSVVEAESNEPFELALALKNINFKNINFDYRNDVSPMRAKLKLGELSGKVRSIDLARLDIQLEEIKLHNTIAAIGLGKSEQTKIVQKEIEKEVVAQVNNPWKVTIDKVDFENNNLAFENDNNPRIGRGMDYSHLKINDFKLKINDLVVTPTRYTGNITEGGFKEQSGFNLLELATEFAYSDTGAYLKNLYIRTDRTLIRDNIAVKYPSVEAITKDIGKLYLDANLIKTDIAVKDMLIFAPQLQANMKGNEQAVIHINGNVRGFVNDLTIPALQVSGIGSTMLSLSGKIKGLPDATKTSYDLNIDNFQTTRTDIVNMLPPKTIPTNVRIPESLKLSGSFKGLATNFTTNLLVQTNKGTATLKGYLNTVKEAYNLTGTLNNLDVGYLIKQDTMIGKVTMNFTAKGYGFKPGTMNTNASARVRSAFIKGYDYKNLALTASVRKRNAVIDADMEDKSLAFTMHGEAMVDDKFATNIKLRLALDSILLQPLGFNANDMRLHGNVVADLPSVDMKAPSGTILINDFVIFNDGKRFKADTIAIAAVTTDTGNIITLNSQIATAELKGKFNLNTFATGAMQVVNKYYNLGMKDTVIAKDQWTLNATVIPDSLLFTLVPSIAGTDTMRLRADFDGSAEKLNLVVNAPKVQVGTQVLDSLTISAGNDETKFNYAATVNKAGTKDFQLQKTNLFGYVADDELFATLNIKDANGKDKYGLGVKVAQVDNGIKAGLSDTLMLDYDKWTVDKTNYIRYDSSGIIVHNFNINNKGESLSINSQTENVKAPIDVVLKNFHLKTLTNLAEQDSLFVDGTINGNVLVRNVTTTPIFTSNIRLDNLSYKTDTVGNIIVKIDNETANAYNADVAITGKGNDVKLGGKYYTGEGKMDLRLDINNLNMASVKPFTFGALTAADGSLKGNVVMKGTTAKPEVLGAVRFENANITPAATGEKLHLSSEEIAITANDITLDRFTLTDSLGNIAVVDGKIYTEYFKGYRFDLTLNADDFRVLNTAKAQNALYYGKLNMDADVTLRGTLAAPLVNADLKINKKTDITFVLPTTNPEIETREGVVKFVDVYGGGESDSVFIKAVDTLTRLPKMLGMDITGTLQSDTAAQITLVIDERSGDALKIRGEANLSGGLDKSGKISLTGNYELQSGSYQLTMSILKRQFQIQPGSVITWTGDPLSATVDITAIYVANTQPINLLQSELSNVPPTDINRFKEKIPFNVFLKMKGELLKPVITFDIELPDNEKSRWATVEAKLEQIRRDEAELNKQVFALLLLGRFIQENPLQNAAEGATLAGRAKASVSRLLTEQLNNLAGSLVKGVDLNFGVNTEDDYSSGTRASRTDLTVGVSKRLLNDRLRVSVGSNFELEGPANTNQNASNIAGDVALDYLLSKDGRYALRAYRRNRYEGVVEGQVIESGVSFLFTLDFNEFKEIFYKKTEEQKREKKIREEKEKALKKAKKEKEKEDIKKEADKKEEAVEFKKAE
ncbi:MAG: translocation/assembly module TamB domain-containing protein [Ferruginibacter sp.]